METEINYIIKKKTNKHLNKPKKYNTEQKKQNWENGKTKNILYDERKKELGYNILSY